MVSLEKCRYSIFFILFEPYLLASRLSESTTCVFTYRFISTCSFHPIVGIPPLASALKFVLSISLFTHLYQFEKNTSAQTYMIGLEDFKWWYTRKWIRQVGTEIIILI